MGKLGQHLGTALPERDWSSSRRAARSIELDRRSADGVTVDGHRFHEHVNRLPRLEPEPLDRITRNARKHRAATHLDLHLSVGSGLVRNFHDDPFEDILHAYVRGSGHREDDVASAHANAQWRADLRFDPRYEEPTLPPCDARELPRVVVVGDATLDD